MRWAGRCRGQERARVEGARGETACAVSLFLRFARLRLRHLFGLRADACGLGIDQVDCFFVLPDGTQEASAASLLGITAAQGRSRLGNPPLNMRTAEILHRCSISSGPTADGTSSISPFARWINRDFTMLSGSVSFMARSTPRRNVLRVRAFDSVEAKGAQQIVRLVSSTCSLHLCW